MVKGLFKWLKETSFHERMKEIVIKRLTLAEGKFIFRRDGELMNFRIKEKLMLWIYWSKRRSFSRKLVERLFFFSIYETFMIF